MFDKILIANRGENGHTVDVSAKPKQAQRVSAKPNCLVRAAHAGDFSAKEYQNV